MSGVRWGAPCGSRLFRPPARPACRASLERWAAEDAPKKLTFQCADEEEVTTFKQLLDFIHSLANELPQGALRSVPPGGSPCVAMCGAA